MKARARVICVLIACLLPLALEAAIIHVPEDQPTIQEGINAALDGDTVQVANGRYTGEGNRDIDFLGKAITVRSENGAEYCIVDCEGSESDSHRGFYFHSGEVADSVLQGFTILNGWADLGGGIFCENSGPTITGNSITGNSVNSAGGGIFCDNAGGTITDNIISGNSSTSEYGAIGGGICCRYSSTTITDNKISENLANYGGAGIFCVESSSTIAGNLITMNVVQSNMDWVPPAGGGGISLWGSSPLVTHNFITSNSARATSGEWQGMGGGIHCYSPYPNPAVPNGIHAVILCGNSMRLDVSAPTIAHNTIADNNADGFGGGIHSDVSVPTISGNTITGNEAELGGGGINAFGGPIIIADNSISGNIAGDEGGGGISFRGSGFQVYNNAITGNEAVKGGGIHFYLASGDTGGNTLTGNSADGPGGGIYCGESSVEVIDTILFGNDASSGDEAYIGPNYTTSNLSISYSDVEGGKSFIEVGLGPSCTLNWGAGMIEDDPSFVNGPLGEHYLSQITAGQAVDSPCIDAGDPASEMVEGTTRTDLLQDVGILDMGYHYPLDVPSRLVSGPGPGFDNPPVVRVFLPFQDAAFEHEFSAYGAPHYGVNVSCGNVDGDGFDSILTGAGPGDIYGPHVRGFTVDGTALPGLSFLAYGTNKWGVNVAAGDIDADGFDEIITGAGPGAVFGPHVRGWNYDGTGSVTAMANVSYFAYGTPRWGVNVSAGDIDGDGYDEIVTGAGPGAAFGPHVRGWNVDGGPAMAISAVSYLAYGTNKYGVNVTCGDVDRDGIDEIVTGAGPSALFGAHVRGWNFDGSSVTPLPGLSFFAWDEVRFGANVFAGADLNDDGRDELLVSQGPDPEAGGGVKVFEYNGSGVTFWFSLEAFSGITQGTNVAAGSF
jgi:hypothetical protein